MLATYPAVFCMSFDHGFDWFALYLDRPKLEWSCFIGQYSDFHGNLYIAPHLTDLWGALAELENQGRLDWFKQGKQAFLLAAIFNRFGLTWPNKNFK